MSQFGVHEEENEEGIWSLGYYANLRRTAPEVTRPEGSNVDLVTLQGDGENGTEPEVLPLCHLDFMMGWNSFGSTGAVLAMAAHHLNTGDGKLVPALEGLSDRCPIRFTMEATDTAYDRGTALDRMQENIRDRSQADHTTSLPAPCAILGDVYSSVTVLAAPVSGVFDIPQVSASATSADLDNKDVYKLFGRTIPSDNGIAVTIVQFLSDVLGAGHFNVVYQNDAFQNALVASLRENIVKYAPDMLMHQVVYSTDSPTGAQDAVKRLQNSRYRYTFSFLWDSEDLIAEAVDQGMAGDGLHQWFFISDTFSTPGSHYEVNSALYRFYQGVGVIGVSGGQPGMPPYDRFAAELAAFPKVPANKDYVADYFSTVFSREYIQEEVFVPDSDLMQGSFSSYSLFWYESVVALGLAACDAWQADTKTLRGVEHYNAFRNLSFPGITGTVKIDKVTGSRDPTSTFYRLLNFRREQVNETFYSFSPTTSYAYVDGAWVLQEGYIFNDGTTEVPIDIGPLPYEEDSFFDNTVAVVGVAVAAVAILVIVYAIVREMKRKANDLLWRIRKEDLVFSDPPQVLGRGTFGEVLLAEYRGTQVAVKQILPEHNSANGSSTSPSAKIGTVSTRYRGSTVGTPPQRYKVSGSISRGKNSGASSSNKSSGNSGSGSDEESGLKYDKSQRNTTTMMVRKTNFSKQIRGDFIEEMRQISRLRHPCVATVMGAVMDDKSPMLVMEYMPMGSLYDVIHNPTIHLDGDMVIDILSDVTQGMRYLHASVPQVIHGDLKAQNVLIDRHFRAKVADFGLTEKSGAMGGTGTPYWMAPELLRGESANTSASDIFSFGVLMFEVCARKEPYEGEDGNDVIAAIKDKNIKKRVTIPSHVSDKARSVVLDCMDENPEARATFDEIDTRLRRLDAKSLRIAKVIQEGGRVENERKENATIFACSITGLDDIFAKMSPFQVSRMVERLQANLRNLAKKHGVFVFETDGNVFMAASNVVDDQPDHAMRMVHFALDACHANQTLIDDTNPSSEAFVCIKAGLHVGSVMAGVIGNRNPRFSLFGENIHVATLMAKNSKLGMINCSREASEAIEQQDKAMSMQFKMRDDEPVFLRCRGFVDTFWVSRKNSLAMDTLERVRANQRLKHLNRALNMKAEKLEDVDKKASESKGGQRLNHSSPSLKLKAEKLEEVDEEATESKEEDMNGLKGSLESRLSRNFKNADADGFV